MAVTLGSVSAALLGYASTGNPKKEPTGANDMIDFVAMILLPVAVLICGYALMVFIWRSGEIRSKQVCCPWHLGTDNNWQEYFSLPLECDVLTQDCCRPTSCPSPPVSGCSCPISTTAGARWR